MHLHDLSAFLLRGGSAQPHAAWLHAQAKAAETRPAITEEVQARAPPGRRGWAGHLKPAKHMAIQSMVMCAVNSGFERNPSAFDQGSLISVDWGDMLSHDLGVTC